MQEVNKKYLKRGAVVTTFFSAVAIVVYVVLNQNKSSVKSSAASNASTNKSPYAKVDVCGSLMAANMMSDGSKSGKSGESKSGKTSKSKASKSSTDTTTTPATTTAATTTTTAATTTTTAATTTTTTTTAPPFGLVGVGVGFCQDGSDMGLAYDRILTLRPAAVADAQGCFDYCEGLPLVDTNALALGFELGNACSCLYNNGALPDDLDTPAFREVNDVTLVDDEFSGTGPIVGVDGTEGRQCFSIERPFELVEGDGFCRDGANNIYDVISTNRAAALANPQGCFDYCEGLPVLSLALGFELKTFNDVNFCACLYSNGILDDDFDTTSAQVIFPQFDVSFATGGNSGTGRIAGTIDDAGRQCFSITPPPPFEMVEGVGDCEDDNDNIYDFIRTVVGLRPDAIANAQGCFNYCEGLPGFNMNGLGFDLGPSNCSCRYDDGTLPDGFETNDFLTDNNAFIARGGFDGTGRIARASGSPESRQCFRVTIDNDEDADSSQFALLARDDYDYYLASQIDDQVSSPHLNEFHSKLVKPVIVDDVATADSKTLIGVLRNDAPAPGQGELSVVSASAVVQSDSYECEPSDNGRRVKFTPGDDFTGKAQCSYTACDEFDQCGDATIFVTVRSKSIEGVRRAKSSKSSSSESSSSDSSSESSSSDSSSSESSSNSSSKSCVNLNNICTSSTRQDSKSNKSGGSKRINSASAPTTCNMLSSKESPSTSSKSKSSKRKA